VVVIKVYYTYSAHKIKLMVEEEWEEGVREREGLWRE
jgi:hypothetical protein